jgi:hypothetical protein
MKTDRPSTQGKSCDICSKIVGRQDGYGLSTSDVLGESGYWEFKFLHYPQHTKLLGSKGERLLLEVLERSGDPTAWFVCEACIRVFPVDRASAQRLCRDPVMRGGSPMDDLRLGPAQWERSLEAATEGWRRAFGKKPTPDHNDPSMPLAMSIYALATAQWKQGSSGSSLGTVGGPPRGGGNVEEPGRRKWWRTRK